jgi:hypothetical protein
MIDDQYGTKKMPGKNGTRLKEKKDAKKRCQAFSRKKDARHLVGKFH